MVMKLLIAVQFYIIAEFSAFAQNSFNSANIWNPELPNSWNNNGNTINPEVPNNENPPLTPGIYPSNAYLNQPEQNPIPGSNTPPIFFHQRPFRPPFGGQNYPPGNINQANNNYPGNINKPRPSNVVRPENINQANNNYPGYINYPQTSNVVKPGNINQANNNYPGNINNPQISNVVGPGNINQANNNYPGNINNPLTGQPYYQPNTVVTQPINQPGQQGFNSNVPTNQGANPNLINGPSQQYPNNFNLGTNTVYPNPNIVYPGSNTGVSQNGNYPPYGNQDPQIFSQQGQGSFNQYPVNTPQNFPNQQNNGYQQGNNNYYPEPNGNINLENKETPDYDNQNFPANNQNANPNYPGWLSNNPYLTSNQNSNGNNQQGSQGGTIDDVINSQIYNNQNPSNLNQGNPNNLNQGTPGIQDLPPSSISAGQQKIQKANKWLAKLPKEQQPFNIINSAAVEQNRDNPQFYAFTPKKPPVNDLVTTSTESIAWKWPGQ